MTFLCAERPDSETLFARVKWYLDDYVELLDQSCGDLADDMIAEVKQLSQRIGELQGVWKEKVGQSGAVNAALIVASMLRDWKLPGAVYYEPRLKRFRLVGEGYKPKRSEICCGTYMPDVDIEMLAEDFTEAMK